MIFRKSAEKVTPEAVLPSFHPATPICDFGDGFVYTIGDALVGTAVLGATGSGKTSSMRLLAEGFLVAEFGGVILCAKKDEAQAWIELAEKCGRLGDVEIVNSRGDHQFNFLEWEAQQKGVGGGLTINVVALLEEVITALNAREKGGMDKDSFWEDALHQLLTNLVELVSLANYPLSLPLMRDVLRSAPINRAEAESDDWKAKANQQDENTNWCWRLLSAIEERSRTPEQQADYEECRAYWLNDFAKLAEKTRSIIVLMFTKLAQPFSARPLRKLFSADKPSTITPEKTFDGAIIIVDLPTQEFRVAGRIAALIWKYCWQVAVMRRDPPSKGQYLRPVFCWADEAAENFLSRSDSAFQAVARSVGGCTVYLGQNINQYRRMLGGDDGFESLMGNLQNKFFCANTGDTNKWASEQIFGERWVTLLTRAYGATVDNFGGAGMSFNEQRRHFVDASAFATLKRGGVRYDNIVEVVAYKNGELFPGPKPRFGFAVQPDNKPEMVPYKILQIKQIKQME